jgi:hypothetical protein
MNEKLTPCPFCGGEAHLYEWNESFLAAEDAPSELLSSFHVACTQCEGGHPPSYSRAEAIAAWETRPDQEAEIKRLREALRGMVEYSRFNERWQDTHPEYVAAARAALGETE